MSAQGRNAPSWGTIPPTGASSPSGTQIHTLSNCSEERSFSERLLGHSVTKGQAHLARKVEAAEGVRPVKKGSTTICRADHVVLRVITCSHSYVCHILPPILLTILQVSEVFPTTLLERPRAARILISGMFGHNDAIACPCYKS